MSSCVHWDFSRSLTWCFFFPLFHARRNLKPHDFYFWNSYLYGNWRVLPTTTCHFTASVLKKRKHCENRLYTWNGYSVKWNGAGETAGHVFIWTCLGLLWHSTQRGPGISSVEMSAYKTAEHECCVGVLWILINSCGYSGCHFFPNGGCTVCHFEGKLFFHQFSTRLYFSFSFFKSIFFRISSLYAANWNEKKII